MLKFMYNIFNIIFNIIFMTILFSNPFALRMHDFHISVWIKFLHHLHFSVSFAIFIHGIKRVICHFQTNPSMFAIK